MTSLEERFVRLIGRSSYEAWLRLRELQDYPKLAILIEELEKVKGTLLETHIDAAYQQTLTRSLDRRSSPREGGSWPRTETG